MRCLYCAGFRLAAAFLAGLLILSSSFPSTVLARAGSASRLAPASEKDAAIVMDGANGRVLYARNPDAIRYPASLTKMMTMYLLFEALAEDRLTLDTPLRTSVHAASQRPTKLGIQPGETISVETAIKAITVLSANDVAVVVAEALGGGNEAFFGTLMTEKAHELGMTHTNFHNASGLPDSRQQSTAREMALLGRHLAYDYPQYYHYFALPSFSYSGRVYRTHVNLLNSYGGTDGIKTGYIRASGFNLVSSVVRDNKHVIGVVMGGRTAASRDREMVRILSAAFDFHRINPTALAEANVPWQGGSGPASDPFNINTAGYENVLAALLDPSERIVVASTAEAPSNPVIPALKPITIASLAPLRARSDAPPFEQGDIAGASEPVLLPVPKPIIASVGTWAVQIGAFASEGLAEAQLSIFAQTALDIVGGTQHLVIPFAAGDGRTLFRARFGLFAENQARDICKRMTQRGQTCFAAPQSG